MIKHKLRIDAYYDLQGAIVKALAEVNSQNFIYQSCINCSNFKLDKEICLLANQRPPAMVIVTGCSSWEDKDGIPF